MSVNCLGIDVGGSSIKAGLVDLAQGELIGELVSAPTLRAANWSNRARAFGSGELSITISTRIICG